MSDSHSNHPDSQVGAVLLCGGSSSRMGYEKFKLSLGGRTLLECVADRLLSTVRGPVVIVGNKANVAEIRELAVSLDLFQNERFKILSDEVDGLGPLEGIRVGLKSLQASCSWAFVTCCDAPLLVSNFVNFLTHDLADDSVDAFVPNDVQRTPVRIYGMSAVYRTQPKVIAVIDELISRGELRVSGLSCALSSCYVSTDDLSSVDKELDSLLNLNDPQQYFDLLERFGETCPEEIAIRLRESK